MGLGIVQASLQGLVDVRSDGTLIRSQQSIAAALCQTILIAHDRTLHNLHVAANILHELLDDSNLLPILFAEISTCRTNNIEKTAHHLANTIEVAWALGTLHHC